METQFAANEFILIQILLIVVLTYKWVGATTHYFYVFIDKIALQGCTKEWFEVMKNKTV